VAQQQKRTPKSWTHYLADEDNPVTLDEYMAGCLSRILGAVIEGASASRHTEGMIGAIDQFAEGLAQRSGLPYASSGAVREALDARRRQALGGAQKDETQ
jgi:hypothetical protein